MSGSGPNFTFTSTQPMPSQPSPPATSKSPPPVATPTRQRPVPVLPAVVPTSPGGDLLQATIKANLAKLQAGDLASTASDGLGAIELIAWPRISDSKIGIEFKRESWATFTEMSGRAAVVACESVMQARDDFFASGEGRQVIELKEWISGLKAAIKDHEAKIRKAAVDWETSVITQSDPGVYKLAHREARIALEDAQSELAAR